MANDGFTARVLAVLMNFFWQISTVLILHRTIGGPQFFVLNFGGVTLQNQISKRTKKSASQCPAYTHHIQTVWILSKEV